MKLKIMIITYLISVLSNLKTIHIGGVVAQIFASIKLAVLLSVPTFILEHLLKWWLGNYDYIVMVLLAIIVDHLLGSWKHAFIKRDFTWLKNISGLAVKIGLVVCVGFLFEGLNVILKNDNIIKDYLTVVTRLIVFLYPAGSAFGNASVISGGVFPPTSWLDKLKKFQKNLDTNEFTDNNNEDQNQ